MMPTSGGRPYEVLVVGSDTAAVKTVADALQGLEMTALPQPEPVFDVSAIVCEGLSQATRYARNIVVVTTGEDSIRQPKLTYERNVYAQPQLVLHLRAANEAQIRAYIIYNVRAMEQQLVLQEVNNGIARLRERHGGQAEKLVKEMFGVRLWVPEDLSKWKCGKDFLWLSNDAASGMQSICIYRYHGSDRSIAEAVSMRDSIMRVNIPGDSEGTCMATMPNTVTQRTTQGERIEMRGLWEVKGDVMGGPFASHSIPVGDSTLVVEAFVYAPSMKKRNLLRRLEACLFTLKTE